MEKPLILTAHDVDATGRVLEIEILSTTHVLAPSEWRKALLPNTSSASAAE